MDRGIRECGTFFFKEMNDYEKVEKALDIFNVSGWAPLGRVDRGTYFAWKSVYII